ncbi:MAG: glycosyltransferase family 4 protein [Candidatus Staskawiczbacteria bacterium]|nr:glycosyltransferase family 4 protein [Candidatus Staskawiczbacteria bacterium]
MNNSTNKKLKVLVCAFSCIKDPDRRFGSGSGGESILGKNIILQLNRFHNVFVLTHVTNKEAIEKENLFYQVKFYYIDLPKFLNFTKKIIQIYAYLWQIKAYFVAKKINKENNFDVFHHVTYANDWMASYIGALLPTPYLRGPGGGAHKVPKKFLKDYSFKEKMSEKVRDIGQWVFKHDPFFIIGQNKAKAILVCNKEAFNALSKKWQKKAYFFPVNGISIEDLSLLEVKEKNTDGKFFILTAGKLIKIKGFDLAIRSFKIFSDKIDDAKLVIIGDGPELKNLKKIVGELNLGEKVFFENWIIQKNLFKEMLSCDIFLFLSLRDGGGNVVVEAMASGTPVVCFDLAGPGFHIDEKCGIKIKTEFPEQAIKKIAEALEKLYSDKELRISLGKGAKEKAEKNYSYDRLGDKLNEIYKKVL